MKTKEQLNTQIDQTIYPNTQGLIDAQKENSLLKEMVDSSVNKMTDAPLDNEIYILYNQNIVKLSNFKNTSSLGKILVFDENGKLLSSTISITEIRNSEMPTKKTVGYATSTNYINSDVWDSEAETITINSTFGGICGAGSIGRTLLIAAETDWAERNGCYEVVQEYLVGTQPAILQFLGVQDIVCVTLDGSNYGTYLKQQDPDYPLYKKIV